ncbi:MAG TPA: glycosyltransferase family 4 protein [Candidatus Acidoferrales bacterium]|nr:glycosyltransferase family 4 protein [Candidatus Acidoferrales bacterium]
MSEVLILTTDPVQRRMAGPAIRYYELGRTLAAAGHQVTLAAPEACDLESPAVPVVAWEEGDLRRRAQSADVVLTHGWGLDRFPFLGGSKGALVADLYDPFPLELLVARGLQQRRVSTAQEALVVLLDQVRQADFFLCASERQRDFWLGLLTAANRVNPATYADDPSLRRLVDVVSFGIPERPPRRPRRRMLRGVIPGVAEGDLVVLWAGGVYNWLDPLTLIHAVEAASSRVPRLRLVFMGGTHPNPEVPEMAMLQEARRLAAERRLSGRLVFFNEGWVPYEERSGWLLDADLGVSTHLEHLETRYSYRTRILDYLWAGLPVVCTAGEVLAETVERERLGAAVPPGDVPALAAALERLAGAQERAGCARRVRAVAPRYLWSRVAGPLLDFCRSPRRAADMAAGRRRSRVPLRGRTPPGWARLAVKAWETLRADGTRRLADRGVAYLERRRRRR